MKAAARKWTSPLAGCRPASKGRTAAFTLMELFVVVQAIFLLALILLPVLQSAKTRDQSAQCFNNQRQLAHAWLMYAGDDQDICAGNNWNDEQLWLNHIHWYQNWISGWLGADGSGGNGSSAGVGGPDNTNLNLIINPRYATLSNYTGARPKLFLCPACIVVAPVQGSGPPPTPPFYPVIRTVSMNCWVGFNCVPPGANNTAYETGTGPVDYSGCNYKAFGKVTDMSVGMTPANIFVFMEERAESIDDGNFEMVEVNQGGTPGNFPNMPADYHTDSANIAFADGHVETHRWHGSVLLLPQQQIVQAKWAGRSGADPATLQDWYWLAQHATVPK